MRSLRILLGSALAPLPEGSAAGRCCYALLHGLTARGHRVTVFAVCESKAEVEMAQRCFPAPAYDVRCFLPPRRTGIAAKLQTLRQPHAYPFSAEMVQGWQTEISRGYEIAHLEGTFTGWLAGCAPAERTILNVHNLYCCDWVTNSSCTPADKLRRSLTLRTERKLLRSFPNLMAVSPPLAAQIAQIAPQSVVHVVPLALDLARYNFVPAQKRPRDPVVALIGSMDWPPSRSAAEVVLTRLWPEIRKAVPLARLRITGRNARTALRLYLSVPGVEIEEDVRNIQPYFENATVLLYPPKVGTGMKVKVLEAFAYGLPLVSNAVGIEGLEVEDGVHAGIHETDAGLIGRIVELLRDPSRQEAYRRAARQLLESKYSQTAVIDRLEEVYSAVLGVPATASVQYVDHR